MKICTKCNKSQKDGAKFWKDSSSKDGLQYRCTTCQKIYTTNNKQKKAEYDKIHQKIYRQTMKGKESSLLNSQRQKKKNPIRVKAVQKVNNAVRDGRLIKSVICEMCGKHNCRIEAHHWSYLEKHWLDVTWCCKHCHFDIHHDKFKNRE